MVVAFFGSTILAVVAFRFLPVWFTPLMFIRLGEQIAEGKEIKLRHHWVPLREMTPYMPLAVIASEDQRFLSHHGFDFEAIEKAAKRNMQPSGQQTQVGCQHHQPADGQERVPVARPHLGAQRA